MSETDRPTVPNDDCGHKIATHYHGTRACYTLDRCRCKDCQEARKLYDRRRSRWLGEFPTIPTPRVDADPVRQHLHALMEQGMGAKRIAKLSGVPHGAVSKLLYGDYKGRAPSRTITRRNAKALLTLELDLADGARVPKGEAVRIVDELVARGWTKAAIGRRVTNHDAKSLQIAKGPYVQAGTLRALRRLLDEPVPLRTHNVTGKRYRANPDYQPQIIPAVTRGVPEDFTPGSPRWLAVMRAGLKQAIEDSYERHGKVAV